MKPKKNDLQTVTLLATALSLIIALFTILYDFSRFNTENILLMSILVGVSTIIISAYLLLIIKRVNPTQYIYISYANADEDIVEYIVSALNSELSKSSKYHFEFFTANSVPYGADIHNTMNSYLEKADVVIIIVSDNYLSSQHCHNDFFALQGMEKRIIPIVTNSYDQLSKLPKNLSNIKALSLGNCKTDKDYGDRVNELAKDLIRQRKN